MDSRKVSIVIPTYNRAYCLAATLESLQRQTYPHWEALIIDDGSTDDTEALVASIQSSDPRIRYVRKENGGVSSARNTGIRLADGDWVAFLDSDDAWEPWKLEAQLACTKELPDVGMVWTDMNAFDAEGNLVSPRHLRKMYTAYARVGEHRLFSAHRKVRDFAPELTSHGPLADATVRWGEISSWMIFGSLVHTSTVLISRERLRAVGFFNEKYRTGEDYEFHLRTCFEGPVALLDAPSIRYRVAGGADQLTAPKHRLEIALNGLRIREAAIAANRARINLSEAELAGIMARANAFVAEELFQQGDFERARAHFRRSGLLRFRNFNRLLKASIAHLPAGMAKPVVELIRGGKVKAKGWRS
ncbi:MAG TPA: glycosyltransferase [Polyangiaceae bacterium]|nr:glycosyltransferase [Polyangiaceae bacterium]